MRGRAAAGWSKSVVAAVLAFILLDLVIIVQLWNEREVVIEKRKALDAQRNNLWRSSMQAAIVSERAVVQPQQYNGKRSLSFNGAASEEFRFEEGRHQEPVRRAQTEDTGEEQRGDAADSVNLVDGMGETGNDEISATRSEVDECDAFIDNIRDINGDPMLHDMIRRQEEECGAYSSTDWRELRAQAAKAVYERRAVMYLAHISKTGGSVVTQTLKNGNVIVPPVGKSNAQIMGLMEGEWWHMPTEQQERVIEKWHALPGEYGSREFGLTRSPLMCPGDKVAYFGTIRHPFRRIQSLIEKWGGSVISVAETIDPMQQTEAGKHRTRDHTVAWYAGFSHDGKVYVPQNRTTLDMAKWRWCALFSGAIAIDRAGAEDWDDLMHEKFGVPSHIYDCKGMGKGTGPRGVRQQCPGGDEEARKWINNLSPATQELILNENDMDLEFWEFQLRTRQARNRE